MVLKLPLLKFENFYFLSGLPFTLQANSFVFYLVRDINFPLPDGRFR